MNQKLEKIKAKEELSAKEIIREKFAKEFNAIKKNKELFNLLKAEIKQEEKSKLILKDQFSNMQINSHSQDIHFKKKHILSLEKFSKIRINSELKLIIKEKQLIFELIEKES